MSGDDQPLESLLLRQAGALADLAFGGPGDGAAPNRAQEHPLGWLPADDLDLDLSDPEQRAFGEYELNAKLGQGGMGVVYRATQRSLDREVALKLLAAGPWSSEDFIVRFKREAHAAAKLQHPNIVTVFDIGEQDELNFFTMQLVTGPTLGAHLADCGGALAARAAAQLVRTVAEAVDYAHRLGVLHLDIKPSNVLLADDGAPLVADFGLARQLGRSMEIDNLEVSGTPSYMAPEQARLDDSRLSPATDVYGLGALLYECLVGKPPFAQNTTTATLDAVLGQPLTAPAAINPGIHPDLDAICRRCLARDAADRYQSASALAADLGRFLAHRPVSARPLNTVRRLGHWLRREPRVAAMLALALAALFAGLFSTSLQWRRAELNSAAVSDLLWQSRREASRDLLRKGRGFEAMTLLAANLSEMDDDSPAYASDRSRLALAYSQAPQLLVRESLPSDVRALALSPDGAVLVSAHGDGMLRWHDARTLAPAGAASLIGVVGLRPGRAVAQLRFLDDHRVAVTQENLDWTLRPSGPMAIFDLRGQRFLQPPASANNWLDVVYSAQGRQALVRFEGQSSREDEVQLWRTDPWTAITPRVPSPQPRHSPWLAFDQSPRAATVYGTLQPVTVWQMLTERIARIGRPELYALRSWSLSSDERFLALGDVEGRVLALDLQEDRTVQFPAALGDEVSWVSFSEDDQWLAAGARNGLVMVFDVRSQQPLTEPLPHDFAVERLTLHRGQQLLQVAGRQASVLWRLPPPSRYPRSAVRASTNPLPLSNQRHANAIAISPDSGLVAAAEHNGLTSIWQLRPSPLLTARGARQIPEQLYFGGDHLADVDGQRVRVVDVRRGVAVTPWMPLPLAPGFAVVAGAKLLVTCGSQLLVFDVDAAAALKKTPAERISLPGTPLRLLLNPDRQEVLLSFPTSVDGFFEERLQLYSYADAQPVAETTLPGPLRALGFAQGGTRLWVHGTNPERVDILSADKLVHEARILPEESRGIAAADFADDRLLFAQYGPDGADELMSWSDGMTEPTLVAALGQAGTHALAGLGSKIISAGANQSLLFESTTAAVALTQQMASPPVPVLAVDANSQRIARASRHAVALYDAAGQPLGMPLALEISGHDSIAGLTFADDGSALLARTALGRWGYWRLADAPLAPAQLKTWLASELPVAAVQGSSSASSSPVWQKPDSLTRSGWELRGGAPKIPPRDALAGAAQLDLGPVYSLGPDGLRHELGDTLIDMSGMPVGTQSMDGVRYDIRGVLLGGESAANRPGEEDSAPGYASPPVRLEVPPQRSGGVRLLMFARQYRPVARRAPYLDVVFHYANGTTATATAYCHEHVPGWTGGDEPVPIGWLLTTAATFYWDGYQIPISNPLIENPFPQRVVTGLSIDWRRGVGLPPVLFAATMAPVAASAENLAAGR